MRGDFFTMLGHQTHKYTEEMWKNISNNMTDLTLGFKPGYPLHEPAQISDTDTLMGNFNFLKQTRHISYTRTSFDVLISERAAECLAPTDPRDISYFTHARIEIWGHDSTPSLLAVHADAHKVTDSFPVTDFSFTTAECKKKGKAFPLQAWTGPWGFRRLRLQNF